MQLKADRNLSMCTLKALIANNHYMPAMRDDLYKNTGIFKMETIQASTKKKKKTLTEFTELNTKANFQIDCLHHHSFQDAAFDFIDREQSWQAK